MTNRDARWFFAAVMAVGILGLVRSQQYYGSLLRGSDARYYYALAHSLVFDQDWDITNDLVQSPSAVELDPDLDGSWRAVRRRADGGFLMKHPIGLSLIEVPPLVAGLAIRRTAETLGYRTEAPPGYSQIEIFAVAVGVLFLIAAGLTAVWRLAAEVSGRWPAAVGVAVCWFGTSLFHYTAVHPLTAHGASFGVLALLLTASRPLWQGRDLNRSIALVGLGLALMFLLRPQQVVVGLFLLPVLLRTARRYPPRQWASGAVLGPTACLIAVVLQVAMNFWQAGVVTPSVYGAAGQGFSLPIGNRTGTALTRRMVLMLFDGSRGLLIFSPVVALSIIGFIRFRRLIPGYLWPAVGNALAQLLVIAAWHPWQGDSFGARMWTDNGFVVVFGLALLFQKDSGVRLWSTALATLACTAWTIYLLVRHMGLL